MVQSLTTASTRKRVCEAFQHWGAACDHLSLGLLALMPLQLMFMSILSMLLKQIASCAAVCCLQDILQL